MMIAVAPIGATSHITWELPNNQRLSMAVITMPRLAPIKARNSSLLFTETDGEKKSKMNFLIN